MRLFRIARSELDSMKTSSAQYLAMYFFLIIIVIKKNNKLLLLFCNRSMTVISSVDTFALGDISLLNCRHCTGRLKWARKKNVHDKTKQKKNERVFLVSVYNFSLSVGVTTCFFFCSYYCCCCFFFFFDYIYLGIGQFHLDFSLIRKNCFLIVVWPSLDKFSLTPDPTTIQ